ncbi:group II intron reverse transcriptase/maturase [Priestia taiwanensis]|uniref:Reverse transcriptase n=1 Tax=Priestia taiwanensis TaxID=1347902 RepID=A0A917AWF7_9BACI|nr:group II intron reverse transcriptase/maturase [Priestia taiwanensis]MBM7363604.1 hypothetical protein [Priestia taiwanensis]GGE75698.1 reverse transcriptase [Priestia taiwanensis]
MATNPFHQLDAIRKASQRGKRITDCYRLMYKKELWIQAQETVCGSTGEAPISVVEIENIIEQLRMGTFRFGHGKKRWEAYVLEVMRIIIECIYEPNICSMKKRKSRHDVLLHMKETWREVTWCICGNMKGWNEKKGHSVFLHLLQVKINDQRFLLLIHNALICGIMKKWNLSNRIEKGDTFRRLLRDIYFYTFDRWMENAVGQQGEYARYENQFIVGLASTKRRAAGMQEQIHYFLRNSLYLQETELFLTHVERPILFLGYACEMNERTIRLEIPKAKLEAYARKHQYGDITHFISTHRTKLINRSELEILHTYHAELQKIAHYYRLATNYHHLQRLFSLAESSFIKTIASKRKSTCRKVVLRMRIHKKGQLCLVGEDNSLHSFIQLKDVKGRYKGE